MRLRRAARASQRPRCAGRASQRSRCADRSSQRLRVLLLLACGLAASGLTACRTAPQGDPGMAFSLRAQRICRERLAELPPSTDPRSARQAFAHCLRSLAEEGSSNAPAPGAATQGMATSGNDAAAPADPARTTRPDAEPLATTTPTAATGAAPAATPGGAEATGPSPEERYLHCRLHSEEIEAASRAYIQARWALLNSGAKPGSPERQRAQADLDRAIDQLGRTIPPPMRGGQDLLPDALRQFQGCDRSRFG